MESVAHHVKWTGVGYSPPSAVHVSHNLQEFQKMFSIVEGEGRPWGRKKADPNMKVGFIGSSYILGNQWLLIVR